MTHDQDLNIAIIEYQELIDANLLPNAEAESAARRYMAEEDRGDYVIGCPDRSGRRAMIVALEVAKATARMDYNRAHALLHRLSENLEDAEDSPGPGWNS